MANTYSNTDWSADSLTKATATSSTVDNVTLGGTLTVTGATQLNSTLTIGVDDTGYDVKFFGATATNGYMLWDESTDDLILGSSSKLGIGTTNPLGILHVRDSASGDNDCLILEAGVGTGVTEQLVFHYADATGWAIRDEVNGSGDLLFQLNANGRIGIGTTSPSTLLHVVSSTYNAMVTIESTATTADNSAPELVLYRNADLTDNGNVGAVRFNGLDSGGNETIYTTLYSEINDETDGTEDGNFYIENMVAGTLTNVFSMVKSDATILGDLTVSGVVTTGVTYTQYFGISEVTIVTAGYHYIMNNGMMNASPVGGDSSALGNGTDPATTLDYSGISDTDTEDIIAAYWYVPIDCTITEAKALATTAGTASETLRFHIMQYDLDTSSNYGDLSSGTLIAHSADISSLTGASLKVGAFTLDSANLTAGKIVIVTIEADDSTDKISAQVFINYKAR